MRDTRRRSTIRKRERERRVVAIESYDNTPQRLCCAPKMQKKDIMNFTYLEPLQYPCLVGRRASLLRSYRPSTSIAGFSARAVAIEQPFTATISHRANGYGPLRLILLHARPSSAQERSTLHSEAIESLMRTNTIPDVQMAKSLGLTEESLQAIMELPGTKTVSDVKTRLASLSQWNSSLRRGVLPTAAGLEWPQEPFRSKFIDVLKKLEMPRFTRRHPKLLASLLRQFLQLAGEFEGELLSEQPSQNKSQQQQRQQQQQQQQQNSPSNTSSNGGDAGQQEPPPDGDANEENMEAQPSEHAPENLVEGGKSGESSKDIQLQLEDIEMNGNEPSTNDDGRNGTIDGDASYAEDLAKALLEKFEEEWSPAMEALEAATAAFDDVDGLLDGPEGFDASSALWHDSGWREVVALSKRLEALRELRDLVRALGRGGGKGPLKRAPEQIYKSNAPLGVILSEHSPEETRGLTRSGDISRMLPIEAGLLAAGRKHCRPPNENNKDGFNVDGRKNQNMGGNRTGANGSTRGSREVVESSGTRAYASMNESVATADGVAGRTEDGVNDEATAGLDVAAAARRLFMAKRAERQLMSYVRSGWVDDEPSKLTGRMEMRPAAELGPVIVCLDTSGSMHGSREVVAKALTLEAMRGAHRQSRKCYVYAFSGPGDVMELELGSDQGSVVRLLSFLKMSFSGGTDVDAPLALSLDRLGEEGWELADILMVTDGEINHAHEDIRNRLRTAQENLGLQIHGLLVGSRITDPMKELCTELHLFKSWTAVGGRPFDMAP